MQSPYQPSGSPAENEPPRQHPGDDGRSVPPAPYATVGWQDPAARSGGQPGFPAGARPDGQPGTRPEAQPGVQPGAQPGFQPPAVPAYPAPAQGLPHQSPHAHGQQGYYPHPQNWLPPAITDPGQWSPHNPGVGLAETGVRFVARCIDTAAFFLLWFVMMMVGTGVSVALGGGEIEGGASNVFVGFYVFNFFLLPIALEWFQVRVWGRSVGKMILGLWVVRSDGSGRVTAGRAFVRALLYAPGHTNLVNWLLPWSVTNVLWQLRDKSLRQCLHDRAAGTVVVQVRR